MSDTDVSEHFVAEVKIVKVRKGRRSTGMSAGPFRDITTIGRVVIPGSDLEALKAKAIKHIELLEDDGDIDDMKGSVTRG